MTDRQRDSDRYVDDERATRAVIAASELRVGDRIVAESGYVFPPIRQLDPLPKSVRVHLGTTRWMYRRTTSVVVDRDAR
jgi:hypothetical protein